MPSQIDRAASILIEMVELIKQSMEGWLEFLEVVPLGIIETMSLLIYLKMICQQVHSLITQRRTLRILGKCSQRHPRDNKSKRSNNRSRPLLIWLTLTKRLHLLQSSPLVTRGHQMRIREILSHTRTSLVYHLQAVIHNLRESPLRPWSQTRKAR